MKDNIMNQELTHNEQLELKLWQQHLEQLYTSYLQERALQRQQPQNKMSQLRAKLSKMSDRHL